MINQKSRTRAVRHIAGLVSLAALCLPVQAFGADERDMLAVGEGVFQSECARCHEVGAGAKNKVGPHLDLIFERQAGSVEAFRYSTALTTAGEDGLKWDAESLNAFVEKPRAFLKGNRMSYRGLSDAHERAALVLWLERATNALPTEDLTQSASVSAGAAPGFTEEILAIAADAEFGEYLAGDCVTCHQVSGQSDGIPSVVGIPKDYFVRALVEYKTNVRDNEVMKLRVQHLSNEEIAHLAEYFSGIEPQ